jgi:hypothetical protein
MPQDASAEASEPVASDGTTESDAHHQQVLADTHRLLELKREQVCILNAENDKQAAVECVAKITAMFLSSRAYHPQYMTKKQSVNSSAGSGIRVKMTNCSRAASESRSHPSTPETRT